MYQPPMGLSAALADPDRRRLPRLAFRRARRRSERVRLLGEDVDLVRPEEVLHHVTAWVAEGRKAVVANHNLHSLYLLDREPGMRRFYSLADLVELDSTPLVWFGRLIGVPSRPFHRCTYLDWRDHFWSVANRLGWRVMYLGGAPGVAERAAARLRERYPRTTLLTQHGYFDATPGSEGNAAVLDAIAAFQPHILFVGMGMPRQELWVADNHAALPDCVIFSVGAAFDYEADAQVAAPRWMGRLGIEWLYRLLRDPRRLFTRYCVEPWFLMGRAWRDVRQAVLSR